MKIKCTQCKYKWNTESKLLYVSCPSCLKKVKIEDKNGTTKQ